MLPTVILQYFFFLIRFSNSSFVFIAALYCERLRQQRETVAVYCERLRNYRGKMLFNVRG